ncbi:hypothetical protein [Nostoc sp.]|uniref:hypothetical protein n=1 Tax=Nostoc sp. TaxID=1180 RepID=UPI002FF7B544
MLWEEVRRELVKQTGWGTNFAPMFNLNEESEIIWVFWGQNEYYYISLQVNEETKKIYTMIIKRYFGGYTQESPGFKIEEYATRKFRIQEPNDIDMVVAKIKKEIPFTTDAIPSLLPFR